MIKCVLYCFPYAGGSASAYSPWKSYMKDRDIEVRPIELKGRGSRFDEKYYESFTELIDDVFERMCLDKQTPYALLGHSMGGLIAYEIYKKIAQENGVLPKIVFISGRNTPDSQCDPKGFHLLDDNSIKKEMIKYGGTANEIIENDTLFNFFLSTIRADYKVLDTYHYEQEPTRLQPPLILLNGDEDRESIENNLRWKQYAASKCDFYYFDGKHFYINHHQQALLDLITEEINKVLSFSEIR